MLVSSSLLCSNVLRSYVPLLVNIDGSCDFGLVSFSSVTFVVLFKVKIICTHGIGLIRDSLANF